eukprot:4915691-Pyramimonas_sp.AAC.1
MRGRSWWADCPSPPPWVGRGGREDGEDLQWHLPPHAVIGGPHPSPPPLLRILLLPLLQLVGDAETSMEIHPWIPSYP